MAIPIEHEDVEELKKWGLGLDKLIERCTFCNAKTRYWHNATNTPVCGSCAATKKVSDLKTPNDLAKRALPEKDHDERKD